MTGWRDEVVQFWHTKLSVYLKGVRSRLLPATLGFLFWFAFSIPVQVSILVLPIFIIAYLLGAENLRPWVYRVGKALDQTANAALFGGNPKETISSHTGRWIVSGKPIPLKFQAVEILTDLFEEGHCVKAIEEPFIFEPL